LGNSKRSPRRASAIMIFLSVFAPLASGATANSHLFDLVSPPHVGVTIFASGYGNEKYGSTQGGFQLEQSVNGLFGLVGRASAYQILKGTIGYDSPLSPASRSATRNFGLFQGGLDITPFQGTSLLLLGGEDVGDAHAPVIEGDFSHWFAMHTTHPVDVSFTGSHYYQNGVTSGTYDVRTMSVSTKNYILLFGGGGAIWGGGSLEGVLAHGGPEVGIFLRQYHLDIEIQGGYGSAHTYGVVTVSRQFNVEE
jgi:hypothetical protein